MRNDVSLVYVFPHSDGIWRDTEIQSISPYSARMREIRTKITPNTLGLLCKGTIRFAVL